MSKLNIIEAMKMPIGTEFEVDYKDGFIFEDGNVVKLDGFLDGKELTWLNGEKATCGSKFIDSIFMPIQQPVSFIDVVNSDKKCKVEHQIVDIIRERKNLECNFESALKNGDYIPLNGVLYILSYYLGPGEIREVIKEGKWYIEESEELEDERLS